MRQRQLLLRARPPGRRNLRLPDRLLLKQIPPGHGWIFFLTTSGHRLVYVLGGPHALAAISICHLLHLCYSHLSWFLVWCLYSCVYIWPITHVLSNVTRRSCGVDTNL